MKGLLQLCILLSTFYYNSSLATASPSSTGPGPAFEPNSGLSEDTIEYQKKYRSLLEENAALRDELCPMCILAVPRTGKTPSVEDLKQLEESLGDKRFKTYMEVQKKLTILKTESYQGIGQIPSYKAPSECTKILSNIVLENAAQELEQTVDETPPLANLNGGLDRVRLLRARTLAIRGFIEDLETGTIEFSCEEGFSSPGRSMWKRRDALLGRNGSDRGKA